MKPEKTIKALREHEWTVSYFKTGAEASEYLNRELDGCEIGFGDSATLAALKLYESLSAHNTVYDPAQCEDSDVSANNKGFLEVAKKTLTTEIYVTSVNAISETGEMVNMDGSGNRVAGSLFGHRKVYFVAGTNKIEPTLQQAVWRVQNVAARINATRFKLNTPCAIHQDRCYNCSSPDRICRTLNIYLRKMNDVEDVEVILIDEELGY